VELVGLAVADLTDDLVAGGPAAKPVQERAGVAERLGDAGQGDHLLGALGQAADQAEAVIDGGGAWAAGGAEEGGAAEAGGGGGGGGRRQAWPQVQVRAGPPFFQPRRPAAARWRRGSRGGTVGPVRAGGPRRRRAPSRGGLAGPAAPAGRPAPRPSGRSDAARPIAAAGS